MTEDLFATFAARVRDHLSSLAVEDDDGRAFTYADLLAASARYANLLRQMGVRQADRVALQTPKSVEALALYLAVLRTGAIYLPLNPAYTAAEVAYFLEDGGPRVLVCDPEREAELAPVARSAGVARLLTLGRAGAGTLPQRASACPESLAAIKIGRDQLAAILYTSGTTGRSKGAMLSHGNLVSNALTLHRAWGFAPGDVLLHALPLFHTHGLFVAVSCAFLNASPMLFLEKFDPDRVFAVLPRATVMMGVPTFYTRLLADGRLSAPATKHMRLFVSGSAPLLAETHRAFTDRTGHRILERYGMTETTMLTSNPLQGDRRAGTVGPPLPGVEVRVVDLESGAPLDTGRTGGIEVRGPNVFRGYWRAPEKTAEAFRQDGFFITGDVGAIDAEGYLTIVGREKDLIISGGLNIYPAEIEDVINAVEGVAETAVIGAPHADFGEAVVAIVTLRPDRPAPTVAALLEACRASLANFKRPKAIRIVEALPRNAMGKVEKARLRAAWRDVFAGVEAV